MIHKCKTCKIKTEHKTSGFENHNERYVCLRCGNEIPVSNFNLKIFSILALIFLGLVFMSGVGSAVECGVTPIDGCTISTDTTFNTGTYYLNGSVSFSTGIFIQEDNVILDCNGSTIVGNLTTLTVGISQAGPNKNNIIIKNCIIKNYFRNMNFRGNNNTFDNITILNNINQGFYAQTLINSTIKNSQFINSTLPLYIFDRSNGLNIYNNTFQNCTSTTCVYISNSWNNFFQYNSMNLLSKGFHIQNETGDVYKYNNINNSLTNNDGWNAGFYSDPRGSNNITISNNIIDNVACGGIIMMKDINWNVSNNWIGYVGRNSAYAISNKADCYRWSPVGIANVLTYKTSLDDGINDNYLNGTLSRVIPINSSNLTILGNIFIGFAVNYINQGGVDITHDLSYSNYISFAFPSYIYPKTEYFMSSSDFNVLTLNTSLGQVYIDDLLGTGFQTVYTNLFKLNSNFMYFKNINNSNYSELILYSLSNALIYNTNGSIYGSSTINNNDGNINITLPPNNATYVLDNFNLTEGVSRENSPISLTSKVINNNGYTWNIASNLSDSITVPIILTIDSTKGCNQIDASKIRITTKNGATYNTNSYTCNDALSQIIINDAVLNTSSSSNQIVLTYSLTQSRNNVCNNLTGGISQFWNQAPTIFIILGSVLIIGFISLMVYTVNRFTEDSNFMSNIDINFEGVNLDTVKIAVISLLILGLFTIAIIIALSGVCSINV